VSFVNSLGVLSMSRESLAPPGLSPAPARRVRERRDVRVRSLLDEALRCRLEKADAEMRQVA